MEWSYSSIIRLIKEYEKRNELWNPQHELYRSTPGKYEAWSTLAQKFNTDIVDVRRKLNSLLASYRREKSKVRQGLGTKWFLYKYLKFLPTYEKETIYEETSKEDENADDQIESTEYLEENEEEEEVQNQEDNQTEGEYIELTTDDNHTVIIKQEHQEPSPKRYTEKTYRRPVKRIIPTVIQKKKVKIQRRYEQDYKERHIRQEYTRKKDDCDSFGEYIADSLRKHDERTKSMIKHAINNIIFEQEMKKYSNHYEVVHEIENPLVLGEE